MTDDLQGRARALLARCDGMAESGYPELAAESRAIAAALLEALDELDGSRSALVALKDSRDRALAVLADQAGRALLPGAFRERAADALNGEPGADCARGADV